jgi:enediyne biosynthesis protein E4
MSGFEDMRTVSALRQTLRRWHSSFRACLLLLALLLGAGCARKAPAAPPGLFQDVAASAGISFRHSNGALGTFQMIETTGSGCALFDYDNDGRLDVFLVQSGPLPGVSGTRRNGLYRNVGKPGAPRFVDVATGSGLEDAGYGQGVAVGDVDNDGFADVYVTAYGGNHLYRNLGGSGRFADVTRQAGVGDTDHGPRYATSAAFGDMDNDGRLDLYVCHYCPWSPALNKVCRDTKQQQDYCSPDVYDPEVHRLYRNRGAGRFQDVTRASGIGAGRGRGLAVAWLDYDEDGRPDI